MIRLQNVISVKAGIHKRAVISISYLGSCLLRNDIKQGYHGKIYSKIYIITAFHKEFLSELDGVVKKGIKFEFVRKPIGMDDVILLIKSILGSPNS